MHVARRTRCNCAVCTTELQLRGMHCRAPATWHARRATHALLKGMHYRSPPTRHALTRPNYVACTSCDTRAAEGQLRGMHYRPPTTRHALPRPSWHARRATHALLKANYAVCTTAPQLRGMRCRAPNYVACTSRDTRAAERHALPIPTYATCTAAPQLRGMHVVRHTRC